MSDLKYEYGVAYETNGEKPELPDDVLVHVMFDGQWVDVGGGFNRVECWGWKYSEKFRIVDERYKATDHVVKVHKEADSNWYKRGELPPVGEICNYKTSSGKSAKVEITAHSRMGICFCEVGRDGESYVSKGQILNFAPLSTDRDMLVDKAADAMR